MGQRLKPQFYTSGELKRIAQLRAAGCGWREIASYTGRKYESVRQKHSWAKRPIDHRHAEQEAIVAEFQSGKTIKEIATARDWSWSRVCMRLTRAGLDAEMRREIRDVPNATFTENAR